jgi:hypothetical protein
MLKKPSMRFSAFLETSRGLLHPFKDTGVVVDILSGICSMMVRCLFVINRSCICNGFWVSPQVKIQMIQIW